MKTPEQFADEIQAVYDDPCAEMVGRASVRERVAEMVSAAQAEARAAAFEEGAKALEVLKECMWRFTAEEEIEWRKSQKWSEAPYHFIFKAIVLLEREVTPPVADPRVATRPAGPPP